MAYCETCGMKVDQGAKFCPGCGKAMAATPPPQQVQAPPQQAAPVVEQPAAAQNDFAAKMAALNNTADTTAEFDPTDIAQNKAMGILAYFGPLVLIPIFGASGSKFARYHANQGLLLLIACVVWSIAYGILSSIILAISWRLYFITSLIGILSLVFLVLAVIGIVNAANGRAKELPLIGKIRLLK